jgi:N utilization substance protein B
MASRHLSRERALQVLYICDVRKQPAGDAIEEFYHSLDSAEEAGPAEHWLGESERAAAAARLPKKLKRDRFMEELVRGTMGRVEEIDSRIGSHSEHWRLERMPAVDRNILRVAVHELMEGATPYAVVIDEALELARRFSGDESVSFINGVLDAVRKSLGEAQNHPVK